MSGFAIVASFAEFQEGLHPAGEESQLDAPVPGSSPLRLDLHSPSVAQLTVAQTIASLSFLRVPSELATGFKSRDGHHAKLASFRF